MDILNSLHKTLDEESRAQAGWRAMSTPQRPPTPLMPPPRPHEPSAHSPQTFGSFTTILRDDSQWEDFRDI